MRLNRFQSLFVKSDLTAQANCWFLVSFIYESMDEVFHGSTVARFLYLRNGSAEVRERIRTISRLIRTFPFEEPVRGNVLS